MADPNPQNQTKIDVDARTESSPKDVHSVLTQVIGEVSQDPSLVRNLVYELARRNVRSGQPLRQTPREAQEANIASDLVRSLELERAIERIETDAAKKTHQAPDVSDSGPAGRPEDESDSTLPRAYDLDSVREIPGRNSLSRRNDRLPSEAGRAYLTPAPGWLTPGLGETIDYAPVDRKPLRRRAAPFVQIIAASGIGLLLYIGVSIWWVQMHPPSAPLAASLSPAPQPVAHTANDPRPSVPPPVAEPPPNLPFPAPRNYGVYAITQGQLVALEQLPIKVPTPRVQVSAEIKQPSRATVAGNDLSFVLFRRDLANNAPQSVSVRVIARVTRAMTFENGKPIVTPVQGSWRIRDKSYEFQVTPIDSNREMVLVQPGPDFVFSPGRYALVLNGYGYDFNVPGKITAPEQCLEQAQIVDGIIVNECSKT